MSKVAPSVASAELTGDAFAQFVLAGCHNLTHHVDELNSENVFPVPDGDTGTNMATACKHIFMGLSKYEKGSSLKDVAGLVAE